MSSTDKSAPSAATPVIDTRVFVVPTQSPYWAGFNRADMRLFVEVLRDLAFGEEVSAGVAKLASAEGIRAIVRLSHFFPS